MKRLILTILTICLLAGKVWGATFYIDKRCANNGNGAAAACAESAGGAGAFNTLKGGLTAATAPAGSTIEVVTGSGPYYPSDCTQSSGTGYWYPTQASDITTWNWNGNTYQTDFDVNDGSYKWCQSAASGKTDWYYLVGSGSTCGGTMVRPAAPSTHYYPAADGNFSAIKSVEIDGVWNDDATSLVKGAPSYKAYNYAYGNYDTLPWSTLYVRIGTAGNGVNPTGTGLSVMVMQKTTYTMRIGGSLGTFVLNNGVFRGSNGNYGIMNAYSPVVLNRCRLQNAANYGIYLGGSGSTGSKVYSCLLVNCGHRAFYLHTDHAATFDAYNNTIVGAHLGLLVASTSASTLINYRNNVTYNLYAGGIQWDNAGPTLTEDHNNWHIDVQSTHGAKAIAFTGGTRQWTSTAATDLPAGQDTSTACTTEYPACGTDPLLVSTSDFHLQPTSPVLWKRATLGAPYDTDFDGLWFGHRGAPIGAYSQGNPRSRNTAGIK